MQIKYVSNIYSEATDKIWTVQNQWKNFFHYFPWAQINPFIVTLGMVCQLHIHLVKKPSNSHYSYMSIRML